MEGINCPHCSSYTKGEINCQCGYEEDKFKGDAVLHIGKYCNNKYTQCKQYQNVRRWLDYDLFREG